MVMAEERRCSITFQKAGEKLRFSGVEKLIAIILIWFNNQSVLATYFIIIPIQIAIFYIIIKNKTIIFLIATLNQQGRKGREHQQLSSSDWGSKLIWSFDGWAEKAVMVSSDWAAVTLSWKHWERDRNTLYLYAGEIFI